MKERTRGGRLRKNALPALARLLDARGTKLALASLIVVSVLPYDALEEMLRPWLLATFGVELAIRVLLLRSKTKDADRAEWFFVTIDLLALLSFLPLEQLLPAYRQLLRSLRLLRLLVLLRFIRVLAVDIYAVLTRREQLQQLGVVSAAVAALSFVTAVLLSNLDIPYDYDGRDGAPEDFWDRAWWAFRQVESPDNLIPNLSAHPVLAIASLILTIAGIFVFSYLIGLAASVVEQVIRAERRRAIGYRHHTIVIGPVQESELLVNEFVRMYIKNRSLQRWRLRPYLDWLLRGARRPRQRRLPHVALLGQSEEPPDYLYGRDMRWVVYRQGNGTDPVALARVGAADAKRIILLAPRGDDVDPDAVTMSRLAAMRSLNPGAHAFLELLDSEHTSLAQTVGGPGTFVLDGPRFAGLFLCHHLLVPRMDELLDELLSARGHELYTHLFVDEPSVEALDTLKGKEIDFSKLADFAHERWGIALLGAFLAPARAGRGQGGLVPVDRFVPWLNPTAPPDDQALGDLEVRTGALSFDRLQGLFGVAETYLPLAELGHELVRGGHYEKLLASEEPPRFVEPDGAALQPASPPKRVLILGANPALPELVRGLDRFARGIEVIVAAPADARDEHLSELEEGLLPGGGRLRFWCQGEAAARIPRVTARRVVEAADEAPIEAVFFLGSTRGADVDATMTLDVLSFLEAIDSNGIESECRSRMKFVVELRRLHRGSELERNATALGLHGDQLTMVSTEQITNYFMVHSAFVPGVTSIYDQLLGSRGQEIVYLEVPDDTFPGDITFRGIRRALRARACIPIALDLPGGVRVNPPAGTAFRGASIRGIYCIADVDAL